MTFVELTTKKRCPSSERVVAAPEAPQDDLEDPPALHDQVAGGDPRLVHHEDAHTLHYGVLPAPHQRLYLLPGVAPVPRGVKAELGLALGPTPISRCAQSVRMDSPGS